MKSGAAQAASPAGEPERDLLRSHVREATERIAAPLQQTQSTTQSAFVFRVGAEWFAIPTRVCERAVDHTIVHSVPHRRGGVLLGVGSVDGELLLVVSLAVLLGVPADAVARGAPRVLLFAWNHSRFAAPVDEVHGVQRYHPDELVSTPATLKAGSGYTSALLSWQGRSVGLLDTPRLFAGLTQGVS